MRKKLFDRYVELNSYRTANKLLLKQKMITLTEYRMMDKRLAQLETDLLTPRHSSTHRQRTLTLVN